MRRTHVSWMVCCRLVLLGEAEVFSSRDSRPDLAGEEGRSV
jgi:hypothetical protein